MNMFVLLAGLIAINAFYVLAEFVSIAVPLVQLEQEAEDKSWARRLHETLADSIARDRYIVVAQLGVTFSSLLLGFFSERALANMFTDMAISYGFEANNAAVHSVSTLLSLLIITYLHVVLGEMVPKRLAIDKPLRYARLIEAPMRWSSWFFYPLVWFLNDCISNTVLRWCNLPISQDVESYTPEDLRLAFEESNERGVLDDEYNEWCQSLINLNERKLRTVMTPRVKVVGIAKDTSIEDALALVEAEGYSRYPVFDGDMDHIIGQVHVRDIFKARYAQRQVTMNDIKRHCERFPEVLELNVALEKMRANSWHMVAVVDEFGGIAGIATMEDLVEEIVGEVFDEFDEEEEEPIDELSEGHWQIDGSVMLEDLSAEVELEVERDDISTVAGLVMDQLERLPKVGDKVIIPEGLEFEVTEVADMVPSVCSVRKVLATETDD